MAGIDQLKVVFKDLKDVIEVVYKLAHHGGFLSVYPLISDFSTLSNLSAEQLKLEILDLDPAERAQLKLILDGIEIQDVGIKAKLVEVFSDLNEAVDLGLEGYAVVKHTLAYVEKLKKLVA